MSSSLEPAETSPVTLLHRSYNELKIDHPTDWYQEMVREYETKLESLIREMLPEVRSVVFGCPDNPEAWVLHETGEGLQATFVSGTEPLRTIDSVSLPAWTERIFIDSIRCGYGGEWRLDPYHMVIAGHNESMQFGKDSSTVALLGRLPLVTTSHCCAFPGWESELYGPWTLVQILRLDYQIASARRDYQALVFIDVSGAEHSIKVETRGDCSFPVGLREV